MRHHTSPMADTKKQRRVTLRLCIYGVVSALRPYGAGSLTRVYSACL